MASDPAALDALVEVVRASAKYAHVCPDLVRRLGARELALRAGLPPVRALREAAKAVRGRLHQVGAAYMPARPRYARWLAELEEAAADPSGDALRACCARILAVHASTRERLTSLDAFAGEVLAPLAPIRSLLDLACGYGPLALPWLPLAREAVYLGCDIYADLVAFLNRALSLMGRSGRVTCCDLLAGPPQDAVHVALLLKTVPCLEQLEEGASERLLTAVRAEHVVVSFPLRSLGGRPVGMEAHYGALFERLAAGKPWSVSRHRLRNELVYVVTKASAGSGPGLGAVHYPDSGTLAPPHDSL